MGRTVTPSRDKDTLPISCPSRVRLKVMPSSRASPCSAHSFSTCWVDMRDTSMPSTDVPGKATWEYSTPAATQQPA